MCGDPVVPGAATRNKGAELLATVMGCAAVASSALWCEPASEARSTRGRYHTCQQRGDYERDRLGMLGD
jgi:hypothetical protein